MGLTRQGLRIPEKVTPENPLTGRSESKVSSN